MERSEPLEPRDSVKSLGGSRERSNREELQIHLLKWMVVIGSVVVGSYTVVHYINGMYLLVAINLPILLVNLLNLFLLRYHQRTELAINVMLSTLMVLLLATAMHGGIDNSGILWLPVYPILVFLLKGQDGGIYWVLFYNLIVFLAAGAEKRGLDITPYEPEFVLHIATSTLVMSLLLFVYEGLRQKLVDELELERIKSEEASSAKSQFLANMSHEIRTPMNGIFGLTNIMLKGDLSQESRQYAELIQTSSETLMGLINDILDISKIEAHKLEITYQPVELATLVDELMGILKPGVDTKCIELKSHLADELPDWLMLDPLRLRQILLNIVGNAIKFTHEGEVRLTADIQDSDSGDRLLHFKIMDTGIGISSEKIDGIFEQFSQVDSTLIRQYGGSGLGLTISRELAEMMGGSVGVSSVEGEGSTFHLYLPLIEAEHDIEDAVDISQLPEQLDLHVLVAEDDRINRLVVTKFLTDMGCRVECVENGAMAVEAVKSGKYDLVLMDLHMPQMDGRQATEEIRRQEPPERDIPIIALTANVISGEREACLQAGMDGFVMKPLQPERLREVLASYYADSDSGR